MAARPKRRHGGKPVTAEPFRIRLGTSADAEALAALERRCFSDPWSPTSIRESLSTSWNFAYVAEVGTEIVAYLIALDTGGTGEVLNLAVAPERRRMGLAKALLVEGLAELERRGSDEVFLEVRESNVDAQRVYERAGFASIGRRPAYYRSPAEDALVLWRRLGPPA